MNNKPRDKFIFPLLTSPAVETSQYAHRYARFALFSSPAIAPVLQYAQRYAHFAF